MAAQLPVTVEEATARLFRRVNSLPADLRAQAPQAVQEAEQEFSLMFPGAVEEQATYQASLRGSIRMTPVGHAETQAPQPSQNSGQISARPFFTDIAPCGQDDTQDPYPRHPEPQARGPPYKLAAAEQSLNPAYSKEGRTERESPAQVIMAKALPLFFRYGALPRAAASLVSTRSPPGRHRKSVGPLARAHAKARQSFWPQSPQSQAGRQASKPAVRESSRTRFREYRI